MYISLDKQRLCLTLTLPELAKILLLHRAVTCKLLFRHKSKTVFPDALKIALVRQQDVVRVWRECCCTAFVSSVIVCVFDCVSAAQTFAMVFAVGLPPRWDAM